MTEFPIWVNKPLINLDTHLKKSP